MGDNVFVERAARTVALGREPPCGHDQRQQKRHGAVGAIEGVSYLAVIGIAGASLATKAKTGSGLKAGPGGLLGLAEGLAFTAIAVGLVVLGFQLADYGYLPNAIPVEGGRCD